MSKWIKGRRLWCDDKETISIELVRKIDKIVKFETYTKKAEVRDLIDEALCDCSVYKDWPERKETKIGYRLLFLISVPMQIFLVPYCAIKWFLGKGWYIDNKSKLSSLMRKIDKYS